MNRFCPLASGSKGNSLFIQSGKTKVLIDCGIGVRALESHLHTLDVDIRDLDAILITHEHTDHIKSIEALSIRYGIPILANSETAKAICSIVKEKPQFKIFSTGETFTFGEFEVHPFTIPHDTLDPVAFVLYAGPTKIGVCTDLGFVTTLVAKQLEKCHILQLEANHEPHMVMACSRPEIYKRRVLGRQGHLSNDAACQLLTHLLQSSQNEMRHVLLAHLSEECNNPEVALTKAKEALKGSEIAVTIAYQHERSALITF